MAGFKSSKYGKDSLIQCPESQCRALPMRRDDLLAHLESRHKRLVTSLTSPFNSRTCYMKPKDSRPGEPAKSFRWVSRVFRQAGITYLIHAGTKGSDHVALWVTTLYGEPFGLLPADLICTLALSARRGILLGNRSEFSWTGRIHPANSEGADLEQFVVPMAAMSRLFNYTPSQTTGGNTYFWMTVTVSSIPRDRSVVPAKVLAEPKGVMPRFDPFRAELTGVRAQIDFHPKEVMAQVAQEEPKGVVAQIDLPPKEVMGQVDLPPILGEKEEAVANIDLQPKEVTAQIDSEEEDFREPADLEPTVEPEIEYLDLDLSSLEEEPLDPEWLAAALAAISPEPVWEPTVVPELDWLWDPERDRAPAPESEPDQELIAIQARLDEMEEPEPFGPFDLILPDPQYDFESVHRRLQAGEYN